MDFGCEMVGQEAALIKPLDFSMGKHQLGGHSHVRQALDLPDFVVVTDGERLST
jgi:hypothetical protein